MGSYHKQTNQKSRGEIRRRRLEMDQNTCFLFSMSAPSTTAQSNLLISFFEQVINSSLFCDDYVLYSFHPEIFGAMDS